MNVLSGLISGLVSGILASLIAQLIIRATKPKINISNNISISPFFRDSTPIYY